MQLVNVLQLGGEGRHCASVKIYIADKSVIRIDNRDILFIYKNTILHYNY